MPKGRRSPLGDRDAFVLFPEGHDFKGPLRERAIAHLRRGGFLAQAEWAERMANVLPPRHGGPLAAIMAAPQADVVFVAHTVLEDVGTVQGLWRRLPFRNTVRGRYWRVPATEVPREQQAVIDWLFAWWERIDQWIDQYRVAGGAAVS